MMCSDTAGQNDLIRKSDNIDARETDEHMFNGLTGHSVENNGQHQQQQLPSGSQHGTKEDQTFRGPEYVPMDLKGNRKE